MPPFLVLQEGYARAFVSLRQDRERLVVKPDPAEHLNDLLDVMAVHHVFHAPAERLEPFAINADVVPKRRGLALAQTIHVHDGDQIVQLANARQRRRLPHRALGDFAIAEQHVGAVIEMIESRGQRHADSHAQTLAQRTRRHVHERQPRRRMAFQVGADLAQLQQILCRK